MTEGFLPLNYQRATARRRVMGATDETHVNEESDDQRDHQHDVSNPFAQPRAEQFDALVRELYPKIRQLSPHLSDIEALRAATRMAEYRMDDEGALMWGIR